MTCFQQNLLFENVFLCDSLTICINASMTIALTAATEYLHSLKRLRVHADKRDSNKSHQSD